MRRRSSVRGDSDDEHGLGSRQMSRWHSETVKPLHQCLGRSMEQQSQLLTCSGEAEHMCHGRHVRCESARHQGGHHTAWPSTPSNHTKATLYTNVLARRAGSAQSPRRSSTGAGEPHGGARISRKHSTGFQDTLARASLSFGQGHSKVEVPAPLDPAHACAPSDCSSSGRCCCTEAF